MGTDEDRFVKAFEDLAAWDPAQGLTAQSLSDWSERMKESDAISERVQRMAVDAFAQKDRLLRRVIDEYWAATGHHPRAVWMSMGDFHLGVSWEAGVGVPPDGREYEVFVLGDDFPQVYAQVRAHEARQLPGTDPERLFRALSGPDSEQSPA